MKQCMTLILAQRRDLVSDAEKGALSIAEKGIHTDSHVGYISAELGYRCGRRVLESKRLAVTKAVDADCRHPLARMSGDPVTEPRLVLPPIQAVANQGRSSAPPAPC